MLQTRAEATHFRETSLHKDVMAFLAGLDARQDPRLFITHFGQSPQGRALPLLVLSTHGVRRPEQAKALELPIVLIMDGIHPGEVEGKEASLAFVRDLLDGRYGDLLEQMTLLVVPLFNPDGNDALDPENRRLNLKKLSGQIGPVVGTRTQSHGINLNRDYLRQQAPEMRLLQQHIMLAWSPDLVLDNHATNGSVHRFHMTVDIPHTVQSGRVEPINFMRERLVPEVMAAVKARGFNSGWYGNFVEDERALDANEDANPLSPVGLGWMTYPHHPRFGSNYRGLTNRLDLLLECYSYLTFEERVATASAWQIETLQWVAAHPDAVKQVVAASQCPPAQVAVRYRLETFAQPVEILTRTPRTLEGAPDVIRIPHLARFVGTTVVDRPKAYVVPPRLADHLRLHGLQLKDITGPQSVQIARVESLGTEGGRAILEAAKVGEIAVSWREESRTVPENWKVVETDQPLGAIAVYLCEPESDDGAVENGCVDVPTMGSDFPVWRLEST